MQVSRAMMHMHRNYHHYYVSHRRGGFRLFTHLFALGAGYYMGSHWSGKYEWDKMRHDCWSKYKQEVAPKLTAPNELIDQLDGILKQYKKEGNEKAL